MAEIKALPSRLLLAGPMIIMQIYLWFTVAIFVWGPWIWQVDNPWKFYLYLAAVHISLGVGYYLGVKRAPRLYYNGPNVSKLINWGILITLIIFLPSLRFRTGYWVPNIGTAIETPGTAYQASAAARFTSGEAPIVEYIRFFLGPILVLPLPVGIFYFHDLNKLQRIGLLCSSLSVVIMFIAMGTNKAIADTLALTVILVITGSAVKRFYFSMQRIAMALGFGVIGFLGFFNFFSAGMLSRSGGAVPGGNIPAIEAKADFENFLIRDINPEAQVGILGLSLYISGGYQALALCLEEPWVPCFGVGHSMFLTRQSERLLGIDDIAGRTYPERLYRKTGFDTRTFFVSIYPWLASDFSFSGTLFIIFLIGFLFGKVWIEVIVGVNPFSIVLFSMLIIMIFYFPANNQIFQDGEGISAFTVSFLAWRLTGSMGGT